VGNRERGATRIEDLGVAAIDTWGGPC